MIPIRSHLKKLSSILGILPLLTLLTPDLDLTSEGAASVGWFYPSSPLCLSSNPEGKSADRTAGLQKKMVS